MSTFPSKCVHRIRGQGDIWMTGVSDVKHFSERAKKHETSKAHLHCPMKLAMLGQVNIAAQLDE